MPFARAHSVSQDHFESQAAPQYMHEVPDDMFSAGSPCWQSKDGLYRPVSAGHIFDFLDTQLF